MAFYGTIVGEIDPNVKEPFFTESVQFVEGGLCVRKKLCIALAAIFVIFLALGIVLNSQQGLYYGDQFWRLKKDGRYVCGKDWVRRTGEGKVEMSIDGELITAEKTSLPDGGLRMDFSDGWAVEHSIEDDFHYDYDFGIYPWSNDASLILTDMEKQDFRFAAAAREERNPFYDGESGEIIGETVHILSAEGDQLDWQELWFGHPEYSTAEREIIVLEGGVRLPVGIAYSAYDCILQNTDGEYLLDAHKLGRIRAGGADTDRCSFSWFLLNIEQGMHKARGDAAPVAGFVLLYLLGAAQMIWPEKLAFFGSRWQFRDEPELSEAGLTAMYIGAAVVMFLGIIMLFVGL